MKTDLKAKKFSVVTETLAGLRWQETALRTEIGRLEAELSATQKMFTGPLPAEIVEANENLLLAALRSETLADTAFNELEEITRTSQHDGLTGTPNRALMQDRMENAIAMAHRHGSSIAVIFVDLDHFKDINDTLGHAVGDEVLTTVARRLEAAVRDSDTVSRHGGDEFLVLLSEVAHPAHAAIIANKILASLDKPCQIGGNALQVSVSLGIALYPKDAQDVPTLISRADSAMYNAKKAGGARFEFFTKGASNEVSPQPDALNGQQHSDSGRQFMLPDMKPGPQDLRVRERRKGSNNDRRQSVALSARRIVHPAPGPRRPANA